MFQCLLTLDAFVHELLVKLLVKLIHFRRPRPPFAVVSRRLERVVRPQHKTNGTTGAKDTEPAHASAGHAPFCRCLTQIWLMGDGHGGWLLKFVLATYFFGLNWEHADFLEGLKGFRVVRTPPFVLSVCIHILVCPDMSTCSWDRSKGHSVAAPAIH